jgi:inner membrane protein involved in colicin E2 resistance
MVIVIIIIIIIIILLLLLLLLLMIILILKIITTWKLSERPQKKMGTAWSSEPKMVAPDVTAVTSSARSDPTANEYATMPTRNSTPGVITKGNESDRPTHTITR